MRGNNNKKTGKTNSKSSSSNKKSKTYSGVVKSPQTKKVTGKVYIKEEPNSGNQNYYMLLIVVTILVGIVAMLVPAGNGIIDYFSLFGRPAAVIWFAIAGLIFTAAVISAGVDKKMS
jgi:hypothetical protein